MWTSRKSVTRPERSRSQRLPMVPPRMRARASMVGVMRRPKRRMAKTTTAAARMEKPESTQRTTSGRVDSVNMENAAPGLRTCVMRKTRRMTTMASPSSMWRLTQNLVRRSMRITMAEMLRSHARRSRVAVSAHCASSLKPISRSALAQRPQTFFQTPKSRTCSGPSSA